MRRRSRLRTTAGANPFWRKEGDFRLLVVWPGCAGEHAERHPAIGGAVATLARGGKGGAAANQPGAGQRLGLRYWKALVRPGVWRANLRSVPLPARRTRPLARRLVLRMARPALVRGAGEENQTGAHGAFARAGKYVSWRGTQVEGRRATGSGGEDKRKFSLAIGCS